MTAACAVVALVASLATPAAHAQRIVLSTYDFVGGSTDLIDLARGTTTRLDDVPSRQMWLTATGEFLLREGTPWRVRHLATGLEVPLPDRFVPRVVHGRDTAVFGDTGSTLTRIDLMGVHDLGTPCAPSTITGMDMAPGTSTLFVQCDSGDVAVVGAADGAVQRRLSVGQPGRVHDLIVAAGGASFLALETTGLGSELRRLDAITGATLASTAWPPFPSGVVPFLVPYPTRDRVLAARCATVRASTDCELYPLDVSTLTVGGALPVSAGLTRLANTVSPDGEWLVASSLRYTAVVHLPDGAVAGATPYSVSVATMATAGWPPLTPVLAPAVVSGRAVSLAWTLPVSSGAATAYRLEAGQIPGAAALTLELGAASATTIPGVPPGRYYARLRAVNANGVSAPSNEIVIDVP